MTDRHTLVGLPHPRSGWPAALARWANSGLVPYDFLTCLSADEVRALLASGREVSAVLLDGAHPQVGPALASEIARQGAVPVGVESVAAATDWDAVGCVATLPAQFSPDALRDTVDAHCRPGDAATAARSTMLDASRAAGLGRTIAVCGPGGTGASCIAMALARGLTEGLPHDGDHPVVLVDGARRADLAMYHDVGDVLPGLPEVLEAASCTLDPAELDRFCFSPAAGYRLVLGQRRTDDHRGHTAALVGEALEALARRFDTVVVDHDGDLDAGSGRHELAARHAVSLALAERADLWFVVAGPGTKGLHSALRCIDDAVGSGIPPERIQVVLNRMDRSPAARSASTAALARLTGGCGGTAGPPVFVADQPRLESVHRDAATLPRRMLHPVTSCAVRLLSALGARNIAPEEALA